MENRLKTLDQAVSDALNWVKDPISGETIGASRLTSVSSQLKKISWKTEKVALSQEKNSSVAVYGPSQAGKSFLVSVLAKPEGQPLVANYPGSGNTLNYIKEINPGGDGESTGIVTRFSAQNYSADKDFPIKLNLLREQDLVCILCNSFFLDCDQKLIEEPSSDVIEAKISAANSFSSQKDNAHLSLKNFWEIEDYLREKFSNFSYARVIINYCEQIGQAALGLDLAKRAELYSIFWGELEFYSQLFIELAQDLQNLNFEHEVFAPKQALHPKSDSIIDVKQLGALLSGSGQKLEVQTSKNKPVLIKKQNLTALTAELWVPLQTIPHKFMNHTDLLDFPGARNRFKKDPSSISEAKSENNTDIADMFLRGKVAFLFDRYVSDREITAMITCIPDGNMEQVDLPELVKTWIESTVGAKPVERDGQKNPLFFVMTKFDKHLEDTASNSDQDDRFSRRLNGSLLEKFSQGSEPWPLHWNSTDKFKNCFWLRNFEVDQVFHSKDETGVEFIDPSKLDRLKVFEAMFLQTKEVQEHFSEPQRAWNAAIEVNDGGVTYLASSLADFCTEDLKTTQINLQTNRLAHELSAQLANFYTSDDFEERYKSQMQKFSDFEKRLENTIKNGKFGYFLNEICLDPKFFHTKYTQNFGFELDDLSTSVFSIWSEHINSNIGKFEKRFLLEIDDLEFLNNEILSHLQTSEKLEEIKGHIGNWRTKLDKKAKLKLASDIACHILNGSITGFSFDSQSTETKTAQPLNISDVAPNASKTLGEKWIGGFKDVVERNCHVSDGQTIDIDNNRALGGILKVCSEVIAP